MFFNELIKAKQKQAEILDEANRVHQDASKKLQAMESQRKTMALSSNSVTFEVLNINEEFPPEESKEVLQLGLVQ